MCRVQAGMVAVLYVQGAGRDGGSSVCAGCRQGGWRGVVQPAAREQGTRPSGWSSQGDWGGT